MVTIHDVARLAGVSPITVSRVINRSGYFSDAVREKVDNAAAELAYVPNTLARSLRSRRSDTLALILTDITNPFFTTLARGVEDAASAVGYTVIFCNTDESESREQQYMQVMLQKRVDGILLVPARSNPASLDLARRHGTPLVVLDRFLPGVAADTVRCDTADGAYQLGRLLLSLGHKRIVTLTGPKDISTARDRVAGYRRAMREAGMRKEDESVYYGEFTPESGFAMARQALASPLRPTAILAGNNFITIGALKALQQAGLRVPEDIALAGFDDLPAEMVAFPFFSVAAQPAYEMGRQALELLLERLKKTTPAQPREIILPVEIIIRKSTGGQLSLNQQ